MPKQLTRRLTLTELARRATLLSLYRFTDGQELNITQMRNSLACIMEVQGEFLRQFTTADPIYKDYIRKYFQECEAKAWIEKTTPTNNAKAAKAKRGK